MRKRYAWRRTEAPITDVRSAAVQRRTGRIWNSGSVPNAQAIMSIASIICSAMNIENKYYMIEKGGRCISITFFYRVTQDNRERKKRKDFVNWKIIRDFPACGLPCPATTEWKIFRLQWHMCRGRTGIRCMIWREAYPAELYFRSWINHSLE